MSLPINTIDSPQFRALLEKYAHAVFYHEATAGAAELAQVVAYADAWQASLKPPLSVRQAAGLVESWSSQLPATSMAIADAAIAEVEELRALLVPPRGEGCQENTISLREWFGLSYAQFLTLPRVVMEAMPEDWQATMTELLLEMDAAFDWLPSNNASYMVRVTEVAEDGEAGELREPDADLCNYHHPNIEHRRLLPLPLEKKP